MVSITKKEKIAFFFLVPVVNSYQWRGVKIVTCFLQRVLDSIMRRLMEGGFINTWMTELIQEHEDATRRRAVVSLPPI